MSRPPNNQPPSVTTTSTTLDYTENDAATVVDAGVTVTDADDVTLASATVSITGNFVAGEDQLAFADTALLQGTVSGGGQTVTLTAQAGQSPTLADYQAALRSVTYVNLSEDPSTLLRTVTFTAHDGQDVGSATRPLNVLAVNDPPAVELSDGTMPYTENAPATVVDAAATVVDFDSSRLGYGPVDGRVCIGRDGQ